MKSGGADSRIEALAKLTIDEKDYALPVTLFRYDDFWKPDSFEASLLEEKEKGIFLCDDQEYEKLTDEKEEEALKEFLEDSDEEKGREKTEKKEKEEIIPEEALLPANYVLYNTVFSHTPEKAIEKFILSMQKNDLSSMMIYTDLYGEEDPFSQDLGEILIRQGRSGRTDTDFLLLSYGKRFCFYRKGFPG